MVPIRLPQKDDSYHCCFDTAQALYAAYVAERKQCTHSVLLHPVRGPLLLLGVQPLRWEAT